MNVSLQKITKEDWKTVSDFMEKAESRTFHATVGETAVKDYIEKDKFYFIIHEDQKVGIIAYEPKENSNYLSELIVIPGYQGRGIATEAIQVLLKQIGNNKPMELHTHPENLPAIKVYWKLGFQIKGWVDNYLGEREPRLLLIKN